VESGGGEEFTLGIGFKLRRDLGLNGVVEMIMKVVVVVDAVVVLEKVMIVVKERMIMVMID